MMEMSFNDRGLIVRLRLILLLLTVTALRLVSSEEEMPVSIINRRLTGDTFQYFIINSSMPTSCIESGRNNLTFLVGDKRCVNNQDLFNECGFAFIPSEGPSTLRITLALPVADRNVTADLTEVEELITIPTFMSNNTTLVDARIATTDTLQVVNGLFCQIANLEVYRGSRLSIMISHNGFSLSTRGTLEINLRNLSYSIDEYKGELYRMNLSCSGEGLSESGCLFFKVGGTTNVANAKFDSAVQGTLLQNYATEPESYDTTASTAISEAISDDQTTVNESVTNSSTSIVSISTSVVTSGLLLYAILGAAGGILILLIIIPILCGIVYCLATGKSCTTSTAAQVEIVIHDQNAQEEGFICLGNFLNSNFDRIVVIDETESEYAHINEEEQGTMQQQTSFINPVELQVENQNYEIENKKLCSQQDTVANITVSAATLRRTQSQEDNLDVVTFDTFKPKLKEKRSISWSSAWETSTIAASRSVDRELSQIYDIVKPATKVRDERDLGFSKLSYPGYPMKELLPSCTDIPSSSMLYASLYADSDHGSAYDVPRKAALAYSVPDVKKKREKKQESKEWSNEAITNPEEMLMLNDFTGHYDTPKCKYTADQEITVRSNVSSLYDQPRIITTNLGN